MLEKEILPALFSWRRNGLILILAMYEEAQNNNLCVCPLDPVELLQTSRWN